MTISNDDDPRINGEKAHSNGGIVSSPHPAKNRSRVTLDHTCSSSEHTNGDAHHALLPQNILTVPGSGNQPQRNDDTEALEEREDEFVPPDGGWGWVVCLASFWVNGSVFGMLNTFGILLPELIRVYGPENENINFRVSLVASLTLFMTFFMSMISSIAADQLGIRKVALFGTLLSFIGLLTSSFAKRLELLYLTYGIIFGIGSSFIYSGSLVILGHYFKKRMGFVNGVVTTGSAVFTLALPYLIKFLLKEKGLAFTLQIESGIIATNILCALAFKPLIVHNRKIKEEEDEAEVEAKQRAKSFLSTESIRIVVDDASGKCKNCWGFVKRYLNVNIWKNKGYVVWAVGVTFSLFGYFIPLVHLNNYANIAFPENDGEILVMMIGGISGVGRLLSGKLGDIPCVNRVRFQQVAFLLYGITTLIVPFIPWFEGLIVVCIILGIMDGFFVCLLGPIAFDLVGPHNASQAMGFLLAMISVPIMMGPMIGGWIFDATQNYHNAFYFAGVPPLIGSAIMFFIPKINNLPHVEGGTQAEAFASISMWSLHDGGRKGRAQSTMGMNGLVDSLRSDSPDDRVTRINSQHYSASPSQAHKNRSHENEILPLVQVINNQTDSRARP